MKSLTQNLKARSSLLRRADSDIDPDDGAPRCPPKPEDFEDPTEEELTAEKLVSMVQQLQLNPDFFFTPANFGALQDVWLQAKLTIERHFMTKRRRYYVLSLLSCGSGKRK